MWEDVGALGGVVVALWVVVVALGGSCGIAVVVLGVVVDLEGVGGNAEEVMTTLGGCYGSIGKGYSSGRGL